MVGTRFILGLYLVTTSAWAGELVILDSTEPTLPVAEVIPDDMLIQLPAGTQVTFVSETGEEFTLIGPFEGLPAPENIPPLTSYMVVHSDLETLPVSETVTSNQMLVIPEGAKVVLVAHRSGQELVLEGPFEGRPGDAQPVVAEEDIGDGTSVGTTRGF